jgi:ubiquitin-associated SH3 domain-containing protein
LTIFAEQGCRISIDDITKSITNGKSTLTVELILYVCPSGPLADQIERYFDVAKRAFSWNPANGYMPHCTLTGFFHDTEGAIPAYLSAIDRAVNYSRLTMPAPVLKVTGFFFREDFHGLTLSSDWLLGFAAEFAVIAPFATRKDKLRLKHWLHLSLAYQFPESEHQQRMELARRMVIPESPVSWHLRFYQRHPDHRWTCHAQWPLMHWEDSVKCS